MYDTGLFNITFSINKKHVGKFNRFRHNQVLVQNNHNVRGKSTSLDSMLVSILNKILILFLVCFTKNLTVLFNVLREGLK